MKKSFIYIIGIVLATSCNDGFTDDFFEYLFNSKRINITSLCSDTPSIFSEGRSFEVYSMSNVNEELTTKNILDKSNFNKSCKYPRYKIPEWKKTPIFNKTDSIYSFIHNEIKEEKNTCFDENTLKNILKQEGNYYTFLYDNLGYTKLFIWDIKNQKLFLLTSYEL